MEKGRENLYEVLGKFYFKLDNILNKICEILEQYLKTGILVNVMCFRKLQLRVKLVNFDFSAKSSITDYNESNNSTWKSLPHMRSVKSLIELEVPKNQLFHFFTFFAPLKSLLFTLSHG